MQMEMVIFAFSSVLLLMVCDIIVLLYMVATYFLYKFALLETTVVCIFSPLLMKLGDCGIVFHSVSLSVPLTLLS